MKSGIHASTTGITKELTHVADCANCRQERWAAHERTLSGVSPYRFQEQTMARISRYTALLLFALAAAAVHAAEDSEPDNGTDPTKL